SSRVQSRLAFCAFLRVELTTGKICLRQIDAIFHESWLPVDAEGNPMRRAITTLMGLVLGQCAGYCQNPETSAASPLPWEDVASWANVHPTETDNIIFANVPLIANP